MVRDSNRPVQYGGSNSAFVQPILSRIRGCSCFCGKGESVMSDAIHEYLENINHRWLLEQTIRAPIPDAKTRMQYKKSHCLQHGKGPSKFYHFQRLGTATSGGSVRSIGNRDRSTVKITEGQAVNYAHVGHLLQQSTPSLLASHSQC